MVNDAHGADLPINRILCTDALTGLKSLPDACIDCVVTSPPYWGLRDYGDACNLIWDGDPACKHRWLLNKKHRSSTCRKCGAWRGQLGLEPHIDLYVKHLVSIFAEVRRVLKPTGTCWLNLGDTYGGSWANESRRPKPGSSSWHRASAIAPDRASPQAHSKEIAPKCLGMVPERVALAMIKQGWILRNKTIWHKPNHMPESVKDRLTRSWEYLYFFVKSSRYHFDLDAIRVPHKTRQSPVKEVQPTRKGHCVSGGRLPPSRGPGALHALGRNPADYWPINSQRDRHDVVSLSIGTRGILRRLFTDASVRHFAVFPEGLCERPILAGCPADGVVLDPFAGAGTVAVVARRHQRRFVGIEPIAEYAQLAQARLRHLDHDLKGGDA